MFICVRRDWEEMENAKMGDLAHFINRHSVIRSSSTAGWKMTNICYVDGMESRNVNTWMGSITTPESSRETKAEPQVEVSVHLRSLQMLDWEWTSFMKS